jgi:hypothetical protein
VLVAVHLVAVKACIIYCSNVFFCFSGVFFSTFHIRVDELRLSHLGYGYDLDPMPKICHCESHAAFFAWAAMDLPV